MKIFCLDLQFFATKKGGGSTKNGRDSGPKNLGQKRSDKSFVKGGCILVRQRGTIRHPGKNVGCARDHTLFAKKSGLVRYYTQSGRKFAEVNEL